MKTPELLWVVMWCPWACGPSWNGDHTSLGALAGTEWVQGAFAVPRPQGVQTGRRLWS